MICRFFCRKHCATLCRRLCPDQPPEPPPPEEFRAFALALAELSHDEAALKRLFDVLDAGDARRWQDEIKRLELGRFCFQLCHVLCSVRCRRRCLELCPPRPLITNVGSIPTPSQVSAQGLGNGEGVPPANVAAPDPAVGRGDHPFAGTPTVKGIFNMPAATHYLVEVADNPGGPYNPIAVPVVGRNYLPAPPWW